MKFPCIIRKYEINRGTDGSDLHHGGDGVVREIKFIIPCQTTCLMQHRVFASTEAEEFTITGCSSRVIGSERLPWVAKTLYG